MFGKLESTGHLNQHGVGLGLMISNSLVKTLNKNEPDCQIQVESEEGKGSTFWFSLPQDYDGDFLEEKDIGSSCSERELKIADELEDGEQEGGPEISNLKSGFRTPVLERRCTLLDIQNTIEKKITKEKSL